MPLVQGPTLRTTQLSTEPGGSHACPLGLSGAYLWVITASDSCSMLSRWLYLIILFYFIFATDPFSLALDSLS